MSEASSLLFGPSGATIKSPNTFVKIKFGKSYFPARVQIFNRIFLIALNCWWHVQELKLSQSAECSLHFMPAPLAKWSSRRGHNNLGKRGLSMQTLHSLWKLIHIFFILQPCWNEHSPSKVQSHVASTARARKLEACRSAVLYTTVLISACIFSAEIQI